LKIIDITFEFSHWNSELNNFVSYFICWHI